VLITGITGKFTAHTLAQGLYSHEVLNVGLIHQNLPNTVAQFSQSGASYIQTNLVNTDDGGTADIVVTANTGSGGTDSANFIDMGWANKNYQPGLEFNNIGNAVNPNDGYLYTQGTSGQNYGNLIIGSTSTSGQLKFISGGGQAANIVARMTSTGLVLNTQSSITFSDGSVQSVAATPANYTQSAFDAANGSIAVNNTQNTRIQSLETVNINQNTSISIIQGVDLTQNTNIVYADAKAQGAFDAANVVSGRQDRTTIINVEQNNRIQNCESNITTLYGFTTQSGVINAGQNTSINLAWSTANSALQNTTVTLNGDLTTLGNVTTNFIRASYKTTNDFTPLVQLTQTASGSVIAPHLAGFNIHTTGREGTSSRIVIDSLGAGFLPNYVTRHARGVANTPTPSQSGDTIGRFSSFGYGNTTFNSTSDARIDVTALENFTDAAHGTAVTVYATAVGSNTASRVAVLSTGNTGIYSANTYIAGELTVTGNSWIQKVNTANFQVIGTANVSGTLGVYGIITGSAQVVLQNTQFSATESALTISASPTTALPSNDGYMLHISGKNGIPSRIVTDSYGTGAYAVYTGRSARGTIESPTAIQANDIISRFSSNGYGTTKYQPLGVGRIDFIAAENFTDANTGSQIKLWNCSVGSNTLTNIATFNGDSVTVAGVLNPAKGFIYTPTTYPGTQTAITINFANDAVIRAQTATGLTVSFSNYTSGKVVELWITNTSGNGQTFTHGCSAINSTTNSTAYNIPATSSILAKYMCFDGDAANTFVSVIHA
jgi:hypothetical protein